MICLPKDKVTTGEAAQKYGPCFGGSNPLPCDACFNKNQYSDCVGPRDSASMAHEQGTVDEDDQKGKEDIKGKCHEDSANQLQYCKEEQASANN